MFASNQQTTDHRSTQGSTVLTMRLPLQLSPVASKHLSERPYGSLER